MGIDSKSLKFFLPLICNIELKTIMKEQYWFEGFEAKADKNVFLYKYSEGYEKLAYEMIKLLNLKAENEKKLIEKEKPTVK